MSVLFVTFVYPQNFSSFVYGLVLVIDLCGSYSIFSSHPYDFKMKSTDVLMFNIDTQAVRHKWYLSVQPLAHSCSPHSKH